MRGLRPAHLSRAKKMAGSSPAMTILSSFVIPAKAGIQLPRDFWDVATLDAIPDPRTLWKVRVRPKDGLSDAVVAQIEQFKFVDLRAKAKEVKSVWPKEPPIEIPLNRPDYNKWDKENQFRLDQAACLWVDEEPTQHLGERAKGQFRKFEKAIWDRILRVKRDSFRA